MHWMERYRTTTIAVLLLLIVVGGGVLLYRWYSVPNGTEIVITPPSPEITVYVEGEVAHPGVYTLADGVTIADAIGAAGGFSDNADEGSVNLAAPLRDGNQVHVRGIGDVPQRVNVNTADEWLLEALPGIGETLARRIVDYRNANGPFLRIEDLTSVDGIGPAAIEKLRDKATVR
jgi:competence protein ComEA